MTTNLPNKITSKMNITTNLPKKITSKMNPSEKTKHIKLRKEFEKLGDTMDKIQAKSTDSTQTQVKKLQRRTEVYMMGAVLHAFRQKLRKKYK